MTKIKRTASTLSTTTDQQGRGIVHLDVGRGRVAKLAATDWDRVRQDFGPTWYLTGNGWGQEYVAARRPEQGGLITLARVVANALAGERVKYRDGDRLNLLPENLDVVAGAAKRSAVEPDAIAA
jgi:hypothetical protein